MKTSLKTILYDTIKKHPVYLEEMYEICEANGYLISNGNRRIRELCHSGLIDRIWGKNAILGYQVASQATVESEPRMEDLPEYQKYCGFIWNSLEQRVSKQLSLIN